MRTVPSWWGLRTQSLVGSVLELICIISASLVFSRVPPGPLSHSSLSSLDDDYSDTYNATYAVINSGETRFTHTHTQDSSSCPPPGLVAPKLLFPVPEQMTTACRPTPPWPTPRRGRTLTGRSPKAPPTTAVGSGSRRHPQCLLLLRPCRPSCSWGPETASETKTQLTRMHCFTSVKVNSVWLCVMLRNNQPQLILRC